MEGEVDKKLREQSSKVDHANGGHTSIKNTNIATQVSQGFHFIAPKV